VIIVGKLILDKIDKALAIFLAVCFVMSVTAAAVCADANPVNNYKPVSNPGNNPGNNYKPVSNPGNNPGNNYKPVSNPGNNYRPGNNPGNNYRPGEKPFFKQTIHKKMHKAGYWGYKTVWHNKDKKHKNRWFTKERYYFPSYYYYI
jgi:hypothetical protein